jgi:YD repeat-containing protein
MLRSRLCRAGALTGAAVGLALSGVGPAQASNNPGTGNTGFFTFRPSAAVSGTQINVASGNLLVRTRDLVDSDGNYHVVVDRAYNSLASDGFSILGPRWGFDVGPATRLAVQGNGDALVTGPSGYTLLFVKQADGSFAAPAGFDGSLEKTSSGWTLSRASQDDQFGFNGSGQLTWSKDSQSRDFTVQGTSAAGHDVLSSYGTSSGRRVNVSYTGDSLVREMDDPSSGHHYYTYTNGKLTGYRSPSGAETMYRYASNGYLDKITEAGGTTVEVNTTAEGKVQSLTTTLPGGVGQTTNFVYTRRTYKSDVTGPDNVRRTYAYDDDWRVTRQYNPDVTPTASAAIVAGKQFTNGTTAVPIDVEVREPDGAGIARIVIREVGASAELGAVDALCVDTPFDHVCPAEFDATVDADLQAAAEGKRQLEAVAIDDEGHEGRSQPVEAVVDRSGPVITLVGSLYDQRAIPAIDGESRHLGIIAHDDLAGVPDGGIGVKDIILSMDTGLVAAGTQPELARPFGVNWDATAALGDLPDDSDPDDAPIDEDAPDADWPDDGAELPSGPNEVTDGDPSVDLDNQAHRFTAVAVDHLGNATSVVFNTGTGN